MTGFTAIATAAVVLILCFSSTAVRGGGVAQCGWPCKNDTDCASPYNPPCPTCGAGGHCASSATTAATPFPSADVEASFSCTATLRCDVGFPGCLPTMAKPYQLVFAIDSDKMAQTTGPTSLLSPHANQQLVERFDLGFQYAIWIDGKGADKKTINCTRFDISNLHMTPAEMKKSFLGESFAASNATTGRVPCSLNSQRMGNCDEWIWVNQFGCAKYANGSVAFGHEPEAWRISSSPSSPSSPSSLMLASMTNTISRPNVCPGSAQQAASIDYTMDWAPSPDSSVFDVPSDSDCPLAADLETFHSQVHPSLRLPRR